MNPDNNDLCLSCHGGQGPGKIPPGATTDAQGLVNTIDGHTYHNAIDGIRPAAGNGSLCTGCHMPFTAKSSYKYDIRTHSFRFLYPEESLTVTDRPNGCMTATCHTAYDNSINKWDPSVPADLNAATAVINANWGNVAPVASARNSATEVAYDGLPVMLDGTFSFDPNGDPITYAWVQTGGPAVTITGPTTATPTFTPPSPGVYSYMLVVSDASLGSKASLVTVNVTD